MATKEKGAYGEIKKIITDDYDLLYKFLSFFSFEDSYLNSPTYYLFTGRRGLWLYHSDGGAVLACQHPNLPDCQLVFPPFGPKPHRTLAQALQSLSIIRKEIRLARVPVAQVERYRDSLAAYGIKATPQVEDVMDWKYPVQVLSTERVLEHSGDGFKNHRCQYNYFIKHNTPTIEDLNRSFDLEGFLEAWAVRNLSGTYSLEDIKGPYEELLRLYRRNHPLLQGFVVKIGGQIVGFNFYELPLKAGLPANSFAGICDTTLRGLSDFMQREECRRLHVAGVAEVNIGGSENEGLNYFKSKFRPIHSLSLVSFNLSEL